MTILMKFIRYRNYLTLSSEGLFWICMQGQRHLVDEEMDGVAGKANGLLINEKKAFCEH